MENVKDWLIIKNNVVVNVVRWDGDVNTWEPPEGSIWLDRDTTPSRIWCMNEDNTDARIEERIGYGEIGFTWDGNTVNTNHPKPI